MRLPITVLCGLAAAFVLSLDPADAQVPRASDGRPSLEGIWTNAFITGNERPKEWQTVFTTEEAAAKFEKTFKFKDEKDTVGQDESEFPERGTRMARIRGTPRTTWIYDPASGKIPYTAAAAAENKARAERFEKTFDHPENRPLPERCLGVGHAGPPFRNGPDLNVHQIVQTPAHVAIASEYMAHTRIIRMGGEHGPAALGQWGGDSVGRWEDDTLVVETINFHPLQQRSPGDRPTSPKHKVTEWFTRISPTELHYAFKVENPELYAQSWKGEMVFEPAKAIHSYACHEGNYALEHILSAGRQADAASASAGR